MKILTFTSLFPNSQHPNHGIFLQHRTKALMKCGHDIRVVAPIPYFPKLQYLKIFPYWHSFTKIPEKENIDGLLTYHPIYFNPPKIGMTFYGLWMYHAVVSLVENIYKEFPFEIIDAHYLYPDGLAAVWLAKKFKVPIVLSARGTDAHKFPKLWTIRPWIKYILKNCQHFISVSENLKQDMIKVENSLKEKIKLIPNGIDTNLFYYDSQIEARKRLQLDLRSKIILAVGGLIPRKNPDVLLDSLHFLSQNEQVYFIGKGELENHIKERIKNENLEKRVFMLGALAQHQIRDWYQAADVLCLPSKKEGSPNVVYEAQGCGTPVIASNLEGTQEVINSSEKGILVDPITPENLASALHNALWEQNYNRSKISQQAHLRTWGTVGQEVSNLLINVLKNYLNE